jgi:hypothetical protein
VLLEESGAGRRFGVSVGPFEASAIVMALEAISPPLPLTHRLMVETLRDAGVRIESIELTRDDEGSAACLVRYACGDRRFARAARPSDGIALALESGALLLADEASLNSGEGISDPGSERYYIESKRGLRPHRN